MQTNFVFLLGISSQRSPAVGSGCFFFVLLLLLANKTFLSGGKLDMMQ